MKEIFYRFPNLTNGKYPETKISLKKKLKVFCNTYATHCLKTLSKIKSTKSLQKFREFLKKWSGPPCNVIYVDIFKLTATHCYLNTSYHLNTYHFSRK